MINTVIRTQTDMVIAFDESDRQMPRYQGRYDDVKSLILRDADSETVFKHWHEISPEPEVVARNNW